MDFTLFPDLSTTLLSLSCGLAFGFLLRKAAVSRFDVIVGQLMLKDFTVMKVILTAILVGCTGIYSLDAIGLIPAFHLSTTQILFSFMGGAVFGVGMGIAGYCPGTAIAALAEGSKDVIFVLLGMLCGSVCFNTLSPTLLPYMDQKDFAFQETIITFFSISSSVAIAGLFVVWALFALGVRRLEKKA